MKSEATDNKFGEGSFPGEKKTLTVNGVDYTFCWCPPGEFMMGSPESEDGRDDDETQHRVKLTRGFWLLETPVTQRMWESVMGTTICQQWDKVDPDWDFDDVGDGPDYPMYYVDWEESVEFCRKLSELTGEKISLPTEAQWEYACRAGSTGAYGGTGDLDSMGWYDANSGDETHEVKGKTPNAWGLYDMHGNVWEWCSDWGDENYYTNSPEVDPQGPSVGTYRVIRGGCWNNSARCCRSACRCWVYPGLRDGDLGFRPLLSPASD